MKTLNESGCPKDCKFRGTNDPYIKKYGTMTKEDDICLKDSERDGSCIVKERQLLRIIEDKRIEMKKQNETRR